MEMGKLKFKCICCGECCTHISDKDSSSKGLPLFEWEVEKIKKFLTERSLKAEIKPIDFILDKKSGKYFCTGYVLAREPCVFLKDNKCLIHKERPIACRAFPLAINPEFLSDVPNLDCFSNCPNFDFKAFLADSLGLEEEKSFHLSKKKILAEYFKTFDEEIMRSSFNRDKALNNFDEIMRTLSEENLIDIELVKDTKGEKVIPFLQFLVENKFITKKDKERIIKRF